MVSILDYSTADRQDQITHYMERLRHRRSLRKTHSISYIPNGSQTDLAKEYGFYINSAIEWTPEDKEDFLFQLRSLERVAIKCVERCIAQGRPDAAYVQAAELLRSLPRWRDREELSEYFCQYKARLRKLVKAVCRGLITSSIAWDNEQKLREANDLIEAFSYEFIAWGMKPSMMLKCEESHPLCSVF